MLVIKVWYAALLNSLLTQSENKAVYIIKAALVSFISALTVALIVTQLFDFSSYYDTEESDEAWQLIDFLGFVIFSPLAETLLMFPIFKLIKRFTIGFWAIVFINALVWSCLHSLAMPIWGIFTFIPFVIFSVAFLTWETHSKKHAFCITACIHGLHNLLASMLVILASF
ncbi:hypothetical protein [Pseudoalteromonas sp.]|uniref:hypothetical protein n=1 Tax=Pseudoalteromonas sp. TaxID=53249 RepID=UPI003562CB52